MPLEPTKLIGYCEECGQAVFATDFIRFERMNKGHDKEPIDELVPIFKCIKCKKETADEDLIPF